MQQPPRPTEIAHLILHAHLREGDLAVDATAGNGHDTLFLARCVGPSGHIHAIDIQEEAINQARTRIVQADLSDRVSWHVANHQDMARFLPRENFSAILFNLGYLPGGDHLKTTSRTSTLPALHAAAALLRPGGLLSVLCYPGHPEGAQELHSIQSEWPAWSAQGWRIASYSLPFTTAPSPCLWLACKP
jgi:tRNA1(Val) A37 N6-methylase TrmN6